MSKTTHHSHDLKRGEKANLNAHYVQENIYILPVTDVIPMASSKGTGVSPGPILYHPPLRLVNPLSEYRHLEKPVKKSTMPLKHPTHSETKELGCGGGPGRGPGGGVVCRSRAPGGVQPGGTLPLQGLGARS